MQATQQPMDFGLYSAPPTLPQLNPAQLGDFGVHQIKSDSYVEDLSGPSSHDESPLRTYGGLNTYGGTESTKKTTKGKAVRSGYRSTSLRYIDGLPAKKRGPKRDSKPAQNRRQELNRQAQR